MQTNTDRHMDRNGSSTRWHCAMCAEQVIEALDIESYILPSTYAPTLSFENPLAGGCSQFRSSYFSSPSMTWNV